MRPCSALPPRVLHRPADGYTQSTKSGTPGASAPPHPSTIFPCPGPILRPDCGRSLGPVLRGCGRDERIENAGTDFSPGVEQFWRHSDIGLHSPAPYIPLLSPPCAMMALAATAGCYHRRLENSERGRRYLRDAFSAGGSNGSVWSFPFCFNRISTFPSASSSCCLQLAESCMPSSNSVRDFSRGTSPFSNSWTIFSRRSRQSSNFTNPIAPANYCNADLLCKSPEKFSNRVNSLREWSCPAMQNQPARLPRSQGFQYIYRRGIAPQRGADLRALHPAPDCSQHLSRNGHPFLTGRFWCRSFHHPV